MRLAGTPFTATAARSSLTVPVTTIKTWQALRIEDRIRALRQTDRSGQRAVDDYQALLEQNERILRRLAMLETRFEKGASPEAQAERRALSETISAHEWYEKALAAKSVADWLLHLQEACKRGHARACLTLAVICTLPVAVLDGDQLLACRSGSH